MEIPEDTVSPEAVAADLERRGYSVVEKRCDDAEFGNTLIVFAHNSTRIRLVRDRGRCFVEVAGAGDWFSPVIWRAFFAARMPAIEAVPFAVQARWLLDDLDRIEAMSDLSDSQLADLNERRSQRAAARRRLSPNG